MSATQTGVFHAGMYGYPVETTLSSEPIPIGDVQTVELKVKRPFEVDYAITRPLPVPACVLDPVAGKITWTVQDGDLPSAGSYQFTLTLNFPTPDRRLIVDGVLAVS